MIGVLLQKRFYSNLLFKTINRPAAVNSQQRADAVEANPAGQWPGANSAAVTTSNLLAAPRPDLSQSRRSSLARVPSPQPLPALEKPWPAEENVSKALYYDRKCSEIVPGLYLGSETIALSRDILKECGVTHIVNAAFRTSAECSNDAIEERCLNYFPNDFTYLSLALEDVPAENARKYFATVIEFMRLGMKNDGGVFVHCKAGRSRSATFVIAFLMAEHGLSLAEARERVHQVRPVVAPNSGFEKQLAKSEFWLRKNELDKLTWK